VIARHSIASLWALLLAAGPALLGHEGGVRNPKPTKARADLKLSERKMAAAKKKLAAQGRYNCCVKPSCSLCARVNGSCNCAVNVAKGLGACGECYGGWQAGRGVIKGVSKKSVKLLPSEKQACPMPGQPPDELKEATDALLRAKQTLVAEKRFFCCIRGGCDQCAHEADCPCGQDLASEAAPEYYKIAGVRPPGPAPAKGVCGDCLDGWQSGHGNFSGIPLSEVTLANMSGMDDASMGTAAANYASGTSQMPKAAPMDMLHRSLGNWNLMVHGELFAIESQQTGPRGRDKFFSTNWFMPMLSRRLGPGTLAFRAMLSLEPATITDERYPLIFQTGETANGGIPIISGQHPHDFFMELAASYQIRLGERTILHFYGGPRGEPALGPTAYPHRLSASEDPIATLGHHDQDSTHISNNVATVGLSYGPVTIEASGFHGREPDEHRWGIEGGAIDSFAARLTVAPTARWMAQFSAGRINKRETTHPLRPSFRTTASVMYVRPLAAGHWATTLLWGRNNDLTYTQQPNFAQFFAASPQPAEAVAPAGQISPAAPLLQPPFLPPPRNHIVTVPTRIPGQIYNSYLAESTLFFKNKHWIWGRAENVDKDSTLIYEEQLFVLLVDERRYARVQAYTAGYEYELPRYASWLSTGLGGQFTYFGTPDVLKPVYGDHPLGIQVFLRFRLAPAAR